MFYNLFSLAGSASFSVRDARLMIYPNAIKNKQLIFCLNVRPLLEIGFEQ